LLIEIALSLGLLAMTGGQLKGEGYLIKVYWGEG